jgi:hypothetical protein
VDLTQVLQSVAIDRLQVESAFIRYSVAVLVGLDVDALSSEEGAEDPIQQVLGCSVSYRIAIGPQEGRRVFTLQTIPSWEEDDRFAQVVKVAGFSLHAGLQLKPGNARNWSGWRDMSRGRQYRRNDCH